MATVVNQMQKWFKIQEKARNNEDKISIPEADNLIKWEAFESSSKCF